MRIVALLVAAVAVLSAVPAQAEMTDAFGNTIVSRYPDGHWVKHWFNADGTYQAHFWDGRRLNARWTTRGDQVCLSEIRPRMIIPRFCSPMVQAEIGGTWSSRDPLGRRVENTLVAGRR